MATSSKAPSVQPRATGRATLADVARLAEVSPITVSRALRGERAVDAALVARVRVAAERLGYVPDPAARALASRKGTHVAVLVPMLSNALFVDLIEAAQRELRPHGYQTLLGITHYDEHEEEQLLREQLMHRPAGLLVTGLNQSKATAALIAASGVPCVHMMELPSSKEDPRLCVGFSQAQAAAAMTERLLKTGARRIAFAAAQLDPRTLQRLDGWRATMQAAGCYAPTLEWLNPAPSSLALGAVMFEQIAAQAERPDAIFFCNDDLAQGGILAALRLGVRVPQDLAVVGFNDLTGSEHMHPPLTTVRTPRSAIGQRSAQLLLERMSAASGGNALSSPSVQPAHIDLGFEVVVRESGCHSGAGHMRG